MTLDNIQVVVNRGSRRFTSKKGKAICLTSYVCILGDGEVVDANLFGEEQSKYKGGSRLTLRITKYSRNPNTRQMEIEGFPPEEKKA